MSVATSSKQRSDIVTGRSRENQGFVTGIFGAREDSNEVILSADVAVVSL